MPCATRLLRHGYCHLLCLARHEAAPCHTVWAHLTCQPPCPSRFQLPLLPCTRSSFAPLPLLDTLRPAGLRPCRVTRAQTWAAGGCCSAATAMAPEEQGPPACRAMLATMRRARMEATWWWRCQDPGVPRPVRRRSSGSRRMPPSERARAGATGASWVRALAPWVLLIPTHVSHGGPWGYVDGPLPPPIKSALRPSGEAKQGALARGAGAQAPRRGNGAQALRVAAHATGGSVVSLSVVPSVHSCASLCRGGALRTRKKKERTSP